MRATISALIFGSSGASVKSKLLQKGQTEDSTIRSEKLSLSVHAFVFVVVSLATCRNCFLHVGLLH